MGFNVDKWQRRIQSRNDISGFVYHLTKAELDNNGKVITSTLDRLIKIIQEKKITGSTTESGFIIGKKKAVCFQDAPISGIVQNIHHENMYRQDLGGKTRYTYVGLAFPKSYIYQNGGRPVIYEQKEIAKKILPVEEHWRIVDFNLSNKDSIIDWTHEREWRIPVDEFQFDINKTTVLLPNQARYKELIEKLPEKDLKSLFGIIQISPLIF